LPPRGIILSIEENFMSVPVKVVVVILNRDSYTLGMAGQAADMDQSGDVAPPPSDIRTAEFLGRRVVEVSQELSAGRAALGRPGSYGVSGGADNQDPERRGVVIPEGATVPIGLGTASEL
jgi:NAD(P)H dehydrogenase (quinone)